MEFALHYQRFHRLTVIANVIAIFVYCPPAYNNIIAIFLHFHFRDNSLFAMLLCVFIEMLQIY